MSHQKIHFTLVPDEDGYPPANVESVWAFVNSDGTYRLDNIPFFTREATLGDVVEADLSDGALVYRATVKPSGNSLYRIIFFDRKKAAGILSQLTALGCEYEQSHIDSLLSINIPAEVSLQAVVDILNEGMRSELCDYEEAIIRQ